MRIDTAVFVAAVFLYVLFVAIQCEVVRAPAQRDNPPAVDVESQVVQELVLIRQELKRMNDREDRVIQQYEADRAAWSPRAEIDQHTVVDLDAPVAPVVP